MSIKTTNGLQFRAAQAVNPELRRLNWHQFNIGTCTGYYRVIQGKRMEVMYITNKDLTNTHFTDVMEWLQWSCKKHKINLHIVKEVREHLTQHLIEKEGFVKAQSSGDLIKRHKNMPKVKTYTRVINVNP